MPEYIVFVMPPNGEDAEPFDVQEWEFSAAMATANRYRTRGWKACIVDYGMPFLSWRVTRPNGSTVSVFARTCDEACIRARVVHEDCDCFQIED